MKKKQQPIWSQRIAAVALGTAIWWNMGTAPEVVEVGASGNVAENVESATCEDAGMITLPDATCVNADPVNPETALDVNPDTLIDAGFFANPNDSGEILYPPNYEPATDAELETWHGERKQDG